ncbi:L-serine ammonia-lyase, partial [Pseudomonas sp. GW247-3R2A]
MRAAALFVQGLREQGLLEQVRRVEVQLYGSLSATGIGHGSDNAVIMGLMGEWPDAIDPSQIGIRIETLRETHTLLLDGRLSVPFIWARDMRLIDENLPFHPNAMTLIVEGEHGELHRDTYYSIGGGFVVDEAQASSGVVDLDRTVLPYDFSSAAELLKLCNQHGLRVSELMMANELAWRSEAEIRQGLLHIWSVMRECVEQGMRHEGILPGGLNV